MNFCNFILLCVWVSVCDLIAEDTQAREAIINTVIPGWATLSNDSNIQPLCIGELKAEKLCLDMRNYKYAGLPGSMEKLTMVVIGGNIFVKEFYANFVVYRVIGDANSLPIVQPNSVTDEIKATITAEKGLFTEEAYFSFSESVANVYAELNALCHIIHNPGHYSIYDNGFFIRPRMIIRKRNGGIQHRIYGNLNGTEGEGVKKFEIFPRDKRASVEAMSQFGKFNIHITKKIVLNLTGTYHKVHLVNLQNPLQIIVVVTDKLPTVSFTQTEKGVLFNYTKQTDPTEETVDYNDHVLAYLEIGSKVESPFYANTEVYLSQRMAKCI